MHGYGRRYCATCSLKFSNFSALLPPPTPSPTPPPPQWCVTPCRRFVPEKSARSDCGNGSPAGVVRDRPVRFVLKRGRKTVLPWASPSSAVFGSLAQPLSHRCITLSSLKSLKEELKVFFPLKKNLFRKLTHPFFPSRRVLVSLSAAAPQALVSSSWEPEQPHTRLTLQLLTLLRSLFTHILLHAALFSINYIPNLHTGPKWSHPFDFRQC